MASAQSVFAVPNAVRCEGTKPANAFDESAKCFVKIVSVGGCLVLKPVESARQEPTCAVTNVRYSPAVSGGPTIEYDSYVAASSPAKRLDLVTAGEYRTFVTAQVGSWRADSTGFSTRHPPIDTIFTKHFADSSNAFAGLVPSHLTALGTANTDWADAISRTAVTHNHDLSFAGGSEDTRYRASLNYMKQQGVT